MSKVTRARLMELLSYCPETGDFVWLKDRRGSWRRRAGDIAGSITNRGIRKIEVDGRGYKAHHLAWVIMTGDWPVKLIDHRDRNSVNNAWSNLREATPSGNSQNRSMGKNNTSGIKGVYWHKCTNKWQVCIGVNGKIKHIGLFADKESAAIAYQDAAKELHGEYASPVRL